MAQITLECNDLGELHDANGTFIATHQGLVSCKEDNAKVTLELVKQGVTVSEIIKLKQQDLI